MCSKSTADSISSDVLQVSCIHLQWHGSPCIQWPKPGAYWRYLFCLMLTEYSSTFALCASNAEKVVDVHCQACAAVQYTVCGLVIRRLEVSDTVTALRLHFDRFAHFCVTRCNFFNHSRQFSTFRASVQKFWGAHRDKSQSFGLYGSDFCHIVSTRMQMFPAFGAVW